MHEHFNARGREKQDAQPFILRLYTFDIKIKGSVLENDFWNPLPINFAHAFSKIIIIFGKVRLRQFLSRRMLLGGRGAAATLLITRYKTVHLYFRLTVKLRY